jgi:hypothetical protein
MNLPMHIEWDTSGLEGMLRSEVLERAIRAVNAVTSFLAADMRGNHRYEDRSGALTRSTVAMPAYHPTTFAMVVEGEIVADTPYAMFVHYGTGVYGMAENAPHRQTPWVYHDEAGFHRTSGAHPDPWMDESMERNYDAAVNIMAGEMQK